MDVEKKSTIITNEMVMKIIISFDQCSSKGACLVRSF